MTPPPTERKIAPIDSNRSGKQKAKQAEEKGSGKKDYDEFIDRNNNGIDDRIEQKKANETPDSPKDSTGKSEPPKQI